MELQPAIIVHGGAWMSGDKNMYMELGNTFAGQYHFTTVVTNYQLSIEPWHAVHPTHIQDVAQGFAWVVAHIAEYGGDPNQIYVFGQSAGGHLVSLLTTDATWLAAHGLSSEKIRKVVSMSGAYNLPDFVVWPQNPLELTSGQVLMYKALCVSTFGGWDASDLNPASPVRFISAEQPEFLLINLNETETFTDMPGMRNDAINFYEKIKALNSPAVTIEFLNESDIPELILNKDFPGDFDGHYEEIYSINTEYWDCKSVRLVAEFIRIPLSTPVLREPVANQTGVSLTPHFSWQPDLAASNYWLQVADNYNIQNPVFDAAVGDTGWTISTLAAGKDYFWRVKAVNALEESDWSAIQSFTTGSSDGVEMLPVISSQADLLRSYPNPFNGAVQIEIRLNHAAESARLEIFNLLGRTVYANELPLAPGLNRTLWHPAADIESGIYFIRVQSGRVTRVHRILYLK